MHQDLLQAELKIIREFEPVIESIIFLFPSLEFNEGSLQ